MNNKFTPEDLSQITREYLERLTKHEVVNLTLRLRDYGINLYERMNLDSSNSSKPPSSDNPYQKGEKQTDETDSSESSEEQDKTDTDELNQNDSNEDQTNLPEADDQPARSPGRQPGSQGFWRQQKPVAECIEDHYPTQCIICELKLDEPLSPHAGHYTYELEREPNGIKIICTHHLYYAIVCDCGHENIEKPGEGYISVLEGRKRNLKLTEYTLVGPMLAAFISALSRECGMSRKKIQRFLRTWYNFDLSIGLICKSIREAGIACYPVVDELIEDIQKEPLAHLDETPWYQKGIFCWLWVVIGKTTVVYRIGTRKKSELLELITTAFVGWLITDGYRAYRCFPKRQRCLAHLIRKAIALTGAVDTNAKKTGDWLLREMRGLIKAMAQGEAGTKECRPILARLKRACNLGSKSDHAKLKSLANEILNDWDAVVAFVKNPGLPATNNEAERALRWAVIMRRITFGTRTTEGSRAFAAQMSVIETCRLRNIDPWDYIAMAIARGRKDLVPHPIA